MDIDFKTIFGRSPNPYVLLDPAFTIVEMNDAYLDVTMRRREDLVGRNMFEAFPSNPDSPEYRQLHSSLARVLRDKRRDHLPLIHYDIPTPDGGTEERYWSATHTPLLGPDGAVRFVLQHTVDVTELHRLRLRAGEAPSGTDVTAPAATDMYRRAEAVQEANAALQEEQARLRSLFSQAPGFMAVLYGEKHVFGLVNAAYQTLVGERELIGRPVGEALSEVPAQGFIDLLDRVYRTGEPYVGREVRVALSRIPGGEPEERFLDFVYQPIRLAGGVAGIFVQGNDVTERKRAQDAQAESEGRFRLVAESAPVMLWMGDPVGKCVYLNRAARAFWGVEDISQFDWGATVHPDDKAALFEPFAEAMAQRKGFTIEARYIRSDGQHRSIRTEARPRFGPEGEFLGMIGVNVDVTDAKAAEAALRTERHLFEVLNRTGAAVAAELDLDRVVQTVTDAGVELTGAQFGAFFYNVVEPGGESYMLYAISGVAREDFAKFPMPRATAVFQPTFRGEGVVRSDDITKDPRYGHSPPHHGMPKDHLPVRSYLAVPVTSRSGEVLGGLFFGHEQPGIFRESHETLLLGVAGHAATAIDNARLFKSREQLNATLEARVKEEVARRLQAEDALRQAQKMEAIGQLTGGIAHDFNNMLAVVTGALSLLERRLARGDTNVGRFIEGAMTGAQRATALTQRLLAFSRQQALTPEAVDVNALIENLAELLARTLGEKIEVKSARARDLWLAFVDVPQLESAILNLAVNSRDAMPGGGRLTIRTENAEVTDAADMPPGQYVVVTVIDEGAGMPPEVLSRAFEPFFTTKDIGKGSGLGLSQVLGFAQQSGGQMRLDSTPGKGTTAKLFLPRHVKGNRQAAPEPVSREANGGRPTETVLVVEDDDRVRELSVEALKELGYSVIPAGSAAEALGVINRGERITLLFTDVVMPVVNGRQLADVAVRKVPGLKVLFTTGYDRDASIATGDLDASAPLIMKPFNLSELASKIRKAIDG